MKFAAVIEYSKDKSHVRSLGQKHHDYLAGFIDNGQLFAAGPMTDHHGALWIFEADTRETAEAMIQADPYNAAGVFVKWQIHPLAYWSAKAHKGA